MGQLLASPIKGNVQHQRLRNPAGGRIGEALFRPRYVLLAMPWSIKMPATIHSHEFSRDEIAFSQK
jgi:hypothetical protein